MKAGRSPVHTPRPHTPARCTRNRPRPSGRPAGRSTRQATRDNDARSCSPPHQKQSMARGGRITFPAGTAAGHNQNWPEGHENHFAAPAPRFANAWLRLGTPIGQIFPPRHRVGRHVVRNPTPSRHPSNTPTRLFGGLATIRRPSLEPFLATWCIYSVEILRRAREKAMGFDEIFRLDPHEPGRETEEKCSPSPVSSLVYTVAKGGRAAA